MLNLRGYTVEGQVYEGGEAVIYRGVRDNDGQTVMLKRLHEEYPSLERVARLRQEYEILQDLQGVEGVIRVLDWDTSQQAPMIVLEDFGGVALRYQLEDEGWTLVEQLKVMGQIAAILAGIHEKSVMHKDINPANIVYNRETGVVKIIDFGIATVLANETQVFMPPERLEGTLAYMSPEQTGRMNRAMDYRTDLYSLGVTFYELLTGKLPFEGKDALAMVYNHIAVEPEKPTAVRPDLPAPLAALVLKLMAKNADERYQSAAGLGADIEHCLQVWQSEGEIGAFKLGGRDGLQKFQLPQKLYGREKEVEQLLGAFERVSQGGRELVLVFGYSGIGKSALVQEVHRPITARQGYFVAGKFDQYQRNIPYASLIQAFQALVRQILAGSEAEIGFWREKLEAALGENGGVVVEVIPEVALIIGEQAEVRPLPAFEAQNRFNLVFQNFIRALADGEHPLTIFLDDLQWADLPSLKLLQLLMTAEQTTHLLVIGAYRDN
ncbi:MAG TPA: AAA family ATPase, partial [Anaerolineae bacterium]|nr:AAA family ATPase [Anaerolineae bacterium]